MLRPGESGEEGYQPIQRILRGQDKESVLENLSNHLPAMQMYILIPRDIFPVLNSINDQIQMAYTKAHLLVNQAMDVGNDWNREASALNSCS